MLGVSTFCLGTHMQQLEYMRILANSTLQGITTGYSLNDITNNTWVCIKSIEGMYGLLQAGNLANSLLKYN